MATILSVSGSPSATSRTARLLRQLDDRLRAQGHDVIPFDVRTLPPEALLHADFRHTAIVEATALFERADGVVIGTPVYKAAYSGLLKSLLDLLPQYALAGKTVLPLATGGTTAHVPGHRPVLARPRRPSDPAGGHRMSAVTVIADDAEALAAASELAADFRKDAVERSAPPRALHDPTRWKVQHIGRYVLSGTKPPRHGLL